MGVNRYVRGRGVPRARGGATLVSVIALVGAIVGPVASGHVVARAEVAPYNVVILMSDDQRWDTVTRAFTPNIQRLRRAPQTRPFRNAIVPNPLCCPSRTSVLSGRYSHTSGVWGNRPPHGGFSAFDDTDTMAVDFDAAGYRTAMIGKYLNGYESGTSTYVAPGWDRWFAIDTGKYFDYGASTQNGSTPWFGHDPADYSTHVIGERAERFVETSTRKGVPFFLYLAYTAPHGPAIPAPRDVGRFPPSDYPADLPPSYNVVNEGDPDFIRAQSQQKGVRAIRERQLESMYAVDRSVGRLLDRLPPHTIVVFLSDNGYLWGEHRWVSKWVPYNESLRIPLMVTSLDGSYVPGWGARKVVLNIDLRPSLQAAAGVPLAAPVDGLDWSSDPPRSDSVIEHWRANGEAVPSYCGVRSLASMYVRYGTGEEGLYDELADPYELHNLMAEVGTDPTIARLHDRLRARAVALCDPTPPGYSWD